ncbi:MAG: hypothetical protein KF736_09155 [Acidobacteria bacterium]|nr:hypothetical protein [Acidobacteriota bacterium]MCW5950218.1 hypothetical protein [Pyrinomonadaceae bacterium]
MLEVSFNSPQCGWMSIGFDDGVTEFHTTTAHAPYIGALADLMVTLTQMRTGESPYERTLPWNRDPEEFDLRFAREDDKALVQIFEYPTGERDPAERKMVFTHLDTVDNVTRAFAATFDQLFEDRDTDEFEFNWRQPFPFAEYQEFKKNID